MDRPSSGLFFGGESDAWQRPLESPGTIDFTPQ
jgi:hypothetical protein